jgi:hypothetical protein
VTPQKKKVFPVKNTCLNYPEEPNMQLPNSKNLPFLQKSFIQELTPFFQRENGHMILNSLSYHRQSYQNRSDKEF